MSRDNHGIFELVKKVASTITRWFTCIRLLDPHLILLKHLFHDAHDHGSYPSSPEAVKNLIEKYTDKKIANNIRHCGEQQWNSQKIEGRMRLASEWAKKHGVKVICNEWATY